MGKSRYQILKIPVTSIEQNCRILVDYEGKSALIFDPGGDSDKIIAELSERNLRPQAILLTHSHFDHCGGVSQIIKNYQKEQLELKLYAHPIEKELRQKLPALTKMFGAEDQLSTCPEPDSPLVGGEILSLLDLKIEVFFTPGHSPGHLTFYLAKLAVIFSGDVIFHGSIGRTDFPGCSEELLLKSIHEKILTLPYNTKILAGHGSDTTIAIEKRSNPFLYGKELT
jgi:glyoxylase-like metal-dependent hydrolase (beta-lactamase superfamily II)